ncbi:OmpH family outer membrane protein [Candidatus Pelagibacter sp.]|nr:OmpH family outer membrane protein [Candidatus Pelagibacter sp.]
MPRFFFSILILLNLFTLNSFGSEKIVYLDLDYLLANSNKGKEVLLNLEQINKKNIELLKKKEKLLSEEEKKLIQQKNILTKDIYSEKVQILKTKIKNYREEKNILVNEFKKKREEDINNFLKLVDKILADYVQKNSIDIVLNKKDILMGKNNYNITEEILKMVNNTN